MPRRKPKAARTGGRATLYDARRLEARLETLPPAFRALFRDAYISARKVRARQADEAGPGLYALVDAWCHDWSRQARPACDAGCAWCCSQDVLMAPFEFEAVRRAIDEAGLAERVREKLAEADRGPRIRVDGVERPVSDCPLLEDRRCLVYAARPLSCRTQFAMNAASCQAACEAARAGDAEASYQRAGEPAVVGMATREAMQSRRRVFLRDALRSYLDPGEAGHQSGN